MTEVAEQRRFHRAAFWISRKTDSGVIGVASTATPRGARASLTAFARRELGAIAPPSPTPFMPNGVNGEAVDAPDGQFDADGFQRLLPGEDVLADGIDE